MFENTFIYSISTTCGKEALFFSRSRTSQWRCLFDEARSYYESILQLDVTELEGLDDLHNPTGVIQEAEHLLAKLYGSDQSFFLVNGTTVGNLAMVMAACRGEMRFSSSEIVISLFTMRLSLQEQRLLC